MPASSRSSPIDPLPLPPGGARGRWAMAVSMVVAILVVTGLAWWDEQREAEAALRDLGAEQALVARSLAEGVRAQLEAEVTPPGQDDPAELLGRDAGPDRAGELALLLAAPGEATLRGAGGRAIASPALRAALDHGLTTLRLTRAEAAALGLVERTAMAGLATMDVPRRGRWGVVAVATAARERDRGTRALWRLGLSVGLASGLVLLFGGLGLRVQRKELALERELAVAEVARARDEELQRAARLATMGTFAMGIAHEISTPLGVIVGRAEQASARLRGDERGARAAQVILEQADHIRQIIRRFVDLARGEAPSMGRADPAEVVRAAVLSTAHRFAKAEVALETEIPAEMPAIQCDRALLEHALVNLLLNACEACEAGGHVRVAARAVEDRAVFVVTDDGAGISAEHAARVTEPFFTTKPGRGSGMGLAIATEIVKSHRGELTLSANPGKGTLARIEIPVAAGGPTRQAS